VASDEPRPSPPAPERVEEPTVTRVTGRRFPGWAWLLAAVAAIAVVIGVLVATGALERREPALTPVAVRTPMPTLPVAGIFIEPDDGRAPILEELTAAHESISLTVYLLSDEEIVAALETAAARGIRVRVLLEEHPFGGGGGQPEMFARLEASGIEIRWADPVYRFSHIKTFVIDDRVAIIMNLNLTNSAFTRNRELAVITTRPDDVAQAVAIFETDWRHGGDTPPGPLVVSPTTSREDLLALIDRAERTLDVYAEVVRDEEMLGALVAAVNRGVEVRLVMSGDAGDGNARDRANLAAAGLDVVLTSQVYIHAKMFLVDGQELFIGSQNMTATSLDQNRELGMILTDAASIERAARTFERDYYGGRPEAP
jgi:phosphatidylserine/phosphatidylglycerophosphate/cardiolipin synthase-like enzyme